ncbi:hypothetical protein Tsubulata_047631 [Turnera subulata]|uniref:Major facilitator superfamily (MFS) profile domain-containing protein n=1 Tax=Turnera subulata TaxID=218843 RepID=A0A9Q0FBD9_9ROSI|nr:hypothetical protein Tsubulata_047631 [Turnera subulata]
MEADSVLHQSPATDAASRSDKTNNPTMDEVVEKCLESYGWRQFLQCILVSIAPLFDAQQVFITVFADAEPPWHCINKSSGCSSSSNICKIPRHEWAWDAGKPNTIISEWSLQCASPFIKGLPASSFFMGCIIGGFTLATLADSSLGRKKVLLLSCLTIFISGIGRTSIGTCALVLLTEKVGKLWRGRAGILGFVFFTLGYISLPVTESPKWLFNQGRVEEAIAVLKGLAPENDRSLDSYLSSVPQAHKQDTSLNQNFYSSFNILLRKKWALRRILAVIVLGFGIGIVYFGMPLGVGNLGYNIYLSVLFNALLELPSYVVTFIVVDKWNRRSSIFFFCVLSGIFSILCVYPGRNVSEAARIGLELGSFFSGCTACNLILIYTTELFPTSVRNSATSIMRQALALSGVFSPALISAGKSNTLISYGVFGIVILLCSLFVLPLPETRGAALIDSVHEEEEEKRKGGGDLVV